MTDDDIKKLSILIDLEAGEARLSRSAKLFFTDLSIENYVFALDCLTDLRNEIDNLYNGAIEINAELFVNGNPDPQEFGARGSRDE